MIFPSVTECSKAPAPVERDPFLDEPIRTSSTAPGPRRRALAA
jgi:hypothetical protein